MYKLFYIWHNPYERLGRAAVEKITSEIKEAIEKLSRNELEKFLNQNLKEARNAAKNAPTNSSIAFWLQTSKEKAIYDNLYYFIETTQHLKLSISDCRRDIEKSRLDRSKAVKEEEALIKYFHSLRDNFIQNLLVMIKCISNGSPFNNIDNQLIYQTYEELKKGNSPTTEEIDHMLSTLNYAPQNIAGAFIRPFIMEGEYENYSIAKKKAIKIHNEMKSKNIQKKLKEMDALQKRIDEFEKVPQLKREIITEWRKIASRCFNINYTDDELNFRPSLLSDFK